MITNKPAVVFILRSFLLLIFILSMNSRSAAQTKSSVFVEYGADYSAMGKIKGLQDQLLNDFRSMLNVPVKITESFPARPGFKMGLSFPVKEHRDNYYFISFSIGYTSTGGRINYQDYSGEVNLDQILNGYSLAGTAGYSDKSKNCFAMDYAIALKFIKTDYKIKSLIRLGQGREFKEIQLYSISAGIEPVLMPSYKIRDLRLGLSISYLLNIPASMKLDSDSDLFLTDREGNQISADWSGLKLGVHLSYDI